MTSDKYIYDQSVCDHEDGDEDGDGNMSYRTALEKQPDGSFRCFMCGLHLVPETLLREAARNIRGILDAYPYADGNAHMRMSNELEHELRRIDAVLGGEAGKG